MFFALFGTSLSFQGPFPLVVGEGGSKSWAMHSFSICILQHLSCSSVPKDMQDYATVPSCFHSLGMKDLEDLVAVVLSIRKEGMPKSARLTCCLWKARKMKDILQWNIFSYSEMR